MADPKSAYLLQGDDEVKIDGWRKRVHERAAKDPEATEVFPDQAPAEEVAAAMAAMTLAMGWRWILVEGVERWKEKDVKLVAAASRGCRRTRSSSWSRAGRSDATKVPPPKLMKAVEHCGGGRRSLPAPKSAGYGKWVMEQAAGIGLALTPDAAQMLVHRIGEDESAACGSAG